MKRSTLEGQRFGHLNVIEAIHLDGKKKLYWRCRCDCGEITYSTSNQLLSGRSTKCKKCQVEELAERSKKHGMTGTRIYSVWMGMHNRCNNNRKDSITYKSYKGRGITVCDEWNDFDQFYSWAINHGYDDSLTIDRIDNDKGYCPNNCRWTTQKDQARNRRRTIFVEIDGVAKSLSDWCDAFGADVRLARQRIHRGIDPKIALTAPPRQLREVI